MPSEIARRSEENEGYLLMAKFLILVGTTIGLMRHTLVPPSRLGFRPIDLRAAVAFGLIAGFMLSLWILSMRAVALRMCESEEHVPFLLREPVWKIFIIITVGAFAEEYWRALSLYLLRRDNSSIGWALAITAIVFGIGHVLSPQPWPKALGRILQAAIGGLFLGGLFLGFQTLMIPFIAHIAVNSFGALIGRRTLSARRAATP